MNRATLQDKLTAALHNYAVGKRQDLKDLVSANPNILGNKGPQDMSSYFIPLLYIRELCTDLMAVGFPVEEVFMRNPGDFLWADWPEVVQYVAKYKPSLLRGLAANGAFTEDTIGDFEPLGCYNVDDDENTAILYDHWPRLIQEEVQEKAELFVNSSNAIWAARHDALLSALDAIPSKLSA